MLAAKAQDGRAGNIWMIDVSSEQAAEIRGVLAGTSATRLVQEALDSIHVRKKFRGSRLSAAWLELVIPDGVLMASAIELRRLGDLAAVNLGRNEAEFFLESLLHDFKVSVFAENERENDPIISC